mgnify:CR=1 FL=1
MNSLFINLLLLLSLFDCSNKSNLNNEDILPQSKIEFSFEKEQEGFLFVSIRKICYDNKELVILNDKKSPIYRFEGRVITINKKKYDIIEEDYLYRDSIDVVSYDPEYSLFILKADKLSNGNYKVYINNTTGIIDGEKYKEVLKFKTPEQYVLDSYPGPTKENPVRANPSENSEPIPNYESYVYESVEIKGDWLKVKNDDDCYFEEKHSKMDISGWIRWRKNGKIILDIKLLC